MRTRIIESRVLVPRCVAVVTAPLESGRWGDDVVSWIGNRYWFSFRKADFRRLCCYSKLSSGVVVGGLKLYPLLFLNACLDFLFKICYFQFFIFPPLHAPSNNFLLLSTNSSHPQTSSSFPRMMVMDIGSAIQTSSTRCGILRPTPPTKDDVVIIIVAEYVFIYWKNVIINCVD